MIALPAFRPDLPRGSWETRLDCCTFDGSCGGDCAPGALKGEYAPGGVHKELGPAFDGFEAVESVTRHVKLLLGSDSYLACTVGSDAPARWVLVTRTETPRGLCDSMSLCLVLCVERHRCDEAEGFHPLVVVRLDEDGIRVFCESILPLLFVATKCEPTRVGCVGRAVQAMVLQRLVSGTPCTNDECDGFVGLTASFSNPLCGRCGGGHGTQVIVDGFVE